MRTVYYFVGQHVECGTVPMLAIQAVCLECGRRDDAHACSPVVPCVFLASGCIEVVEGGTLLCVRHT